jgi:glycosyltransferase involved in cell wall biosynthesis
MAAGAVPLVFGAAGPAEIVQDRQNGRHWNTLDELASITLEMVGDDERRDGLASAAVRRAADFSATAFAERLAHFVASDVGT